MKVIDLLGDDFTAESDRLAKLCLKEFEPDVVIGIASGGQYVLEAMGSLAQYKQLIVKRQRSSTKKKEKIKVKYLLKLLPLRLKNLLRVVEVLRAEDRFIRNSRKASKGEIVHIKGDINCLSNKHGIKVLVVDDAVDSGSTFLDIIQYIKEINNTAVVKTAALTITFNNPLYFPDYYFYHRVLLRCPWAMDVK